MPIREQSHIQRAEVARVTYSEKAHPATKSQPKFVPVTLKTSSAAGQPHQRPFRNCRGDARIRQYQWPDRFCIPREGVLNI
jgi:hypothetical protein